jgi:RecA-family ATPase
VRAIPLSPGSVGSFSAAGSTGKTSILTGLAVHRAQGLNFLGMPTRAEKTLVLSTEDGLVDYRRKIRAWTATNAKSDLRAIAENLAFMPMQGEPLRVNSSRFGSYEVDENVIDMLADAIKTRHPGCDLVIAETVSRLALQEDNAANSALVSAFERLGRLAGVTVLLVGHTSKAAFREGISDA